MSKLNRLAHAKAGQMRSRALSVIGLGILASGTLALPEYAHAASSYATLTQLIKDLVTWLFIDGGPYIFMAALGIVCIMVGKGWIHIKTGVIMVVVCFLFFCVPASVVYLKQQAAVAINNG
ncbi:mating pair formation protein [Burkholderia cenocepacia]|uniref:mating pair formation protein n=1 Tax=Burkholderia cenocepacia TaxID=95486 RepID=UPI002AB6A4A6|nr:mating pair formation protein [Burkholderia cenocepacia]